jgi:hypothetical protein
MSHEVNALWAAHIVHHQSEDYNLSVALRQSWFQSAFSWVFYLPLALFGFDPIMFLTISSFNTLYQFWIHTRTIGSMGPLEWILNTPSHHRVHHGSDPKYLDKNHAGTLIIWDRIFGTFKKEMEEPHYGITSPLKSWNPVWANFHYWRDLFNLASHAVGWKDKVLVFIKPPGWRPEYLGSFQQPLEVDSSLYQKYDAKTQKSIHLYLLIQFVMVLAMSTAILFLQNKFNMIQLIAFTVFVIVSLMNFGGLFEMKEWCVKAEILRLISLPLCSLLLLQNANFTILFSTCLFIAAISLLYFQIVFSNARKQQPKINS